MTDLVRSTMYISNHIHRFKCNGTMVNYSLFNKKNSKQLKKHKNEYIWSYIHVDGCGLIYIAPVTLYVSSSISLPLY